jgi:hypothetical protein
VVSQLVHRQPYIVIFLGLWWWIICRVLFRPPSHRISRRDSYYLRPSVRARPAPPATPARPRRLAGHPDYCPCRDCNSSAGVMGAQRPEPPEVMPEPSDRLDLADKPCRHELGVARVIADGHLVRYVCANGWCQASWPADTVFPAGTVIVNQKEG